VYSAALFTLVPFEAVGEVVVGGEELAQTDERYA
jgi:hypothetical protein